MDFLAFGPDIEDVVPAAAAAVSASDQPPWMVAQETASPASSPLVALHNEILCLIDLVRPTEVELAARDALVQELGGMVQLLFPDCSLHVFGSQMTNILTPNSDLDLVSHTKIFLLSVLFYLHSASGMFFTVVHHQALMGVNGKGVEPLYLLQGAIIERGIASYVEVIANAKVPIIKFDHIASGVSVDILCDNASGMETGKIMKRFTADYPALIPLTILLKIFLVIMYASRVMHIVLVLIYLSLFLLDIRVSGN